MEVDTSGITMRRFLAVILPAISIVGALLACALILDWQSAFDGSSTAGRRSFIIGRLQEVFGSQFVGWLAAALLFPVFAIVGWLFGRAIYLRLYKNQIEAEQDEQALAEIRAEMVRRQGFDVPEDDKP
jgi:Zn-dependent protease with chaperone function